MGKKQKRKKCRDTLAHILCLDVKNEKVYKILVTKTGNNTGTLLSFHCSYQPLPQIWVLQQTTTKKHWLTTNITKLQLTLVDFSLLVTCYRICDRPRDSDNFLRIMNDSWTRIFITIETKSRVNEKIRLQKNTAKKTKTNTFIHFWIIDFKKKNWNGVFFFFAA